MKIDLSLAMAAIAMAIAIFSVITFYLSSIRLRGTIYRDELNRVELDRTRLALEADIKEIYNQIYRDRGRWEEINHLALDMSKVAKFRSKDEQEFAPVEPYRFLKNFGISIDKIKIRQNQVFLLTPLGDQENLVSKNIYAVCEKAGLRIMRGDEHKISGNILPVIINEITKSRFVIANLNGRNPNVFYEMGIAQALGKDVLMIAHREDVDDIPFDLAQQQIIFYRSPAELRDRLATAISQLGWEINRSL